MAVVPVPDNTRNYCRIESPTGAGAEEQEQVQRSLTVDLEAQSSQKPILKLIASVEAASIFSWPFREEVNRKKSEQLQFLSQEANYYCGQLRRNSTSPEVFYCLALLEKEFSAVAGLGQLMLELLSQEIDSLLPQPGQQVMIALYTALAQLSQESIGSSGWKVFKVLEIVNDCAAGEGERHSGFEAELPAMLAEIDARLTALKAEFEEHFVIRWFLAAVISKPEVFLKRPAVWQRATHSVKRKSRWYWTSLGEITHSLVKQGRLTEEWTSIGFSHTEVYVFLDTVAEETMPAFAFNMSKLQSVYANQASDAKQLKNRALGGLATSVIACTQFVVKNLPAESSQSALNMNITSTG
eukprot:TRINITY_DN55503_c0_g1_i1.p1 TRINITY_DN55503_c0_g1~~TRINITY_DN55503_c0_g1_i1.p1  ORF type:complete len:354 (-),score=79.15 TRINITY_DN55503_c0_g1_i1:358-1419(-)